jgi:hypothetical protein
MVRVGHERLRSSLTWLIPTSPDQTAGARTTLGAPPGSFFVEMGPSAAARETFRERVAALSCSATENLRGHHARRTSSIQADGATHRPR